jgi:hypothetical protein
VKAHGFKKPDDEERTTDAAGEPKAPVEPKNREEPVPFKRCSLCGWIWQTKREFLDDSTLALNGYQGSIRRLRMGEMGHGLLLFTHRRPDCGTTIAIEAKKFKDDPADS